MTDEGGRETALWALADLVTPMAVRVAATLRIADHLADGQQTAPALAEATNVNVDALDRVLRHLVTVDVFSRDESGRYGLTALGEALRDDGVRTMLDIEGAIGRADLSFVRLLDSVRTGQPAFAEQFGRPFWDDLAADPARTRSYDAQMGADADGWAKAIAPAYDWGSLGHLVDVGGGNATVLSAILKHYPTLRGTVLDQPATAETARKALTARGLADRAAAIAGSFFDPLPPGAGGYLLTAILHDWDDNAARAILRRCAEAAGTAGSVFVVERVGADGESPNTGMDLRMLAYFGGRERGVAGIVALGEDAGLKLTAVYPAGTLAIVQLAATPH